MRRTREVIETVATAAVAAVNDEYVAYVADSTYVGRDVAGYWVSDNGEEVGGLTADQAVEVIVENLDIQVDFIFATWAC